MSPPLLPHSTWTAPGQCNGVVQAIHGAASHIRLAVGPRLKSPWAHSDSSGPVCQYIRIHQVEVSICIIINQPNVASWILIDHHQFWCINSVPMYQHTSLPISKKWVRTYQQSAYTLIHQQQQTLCDSHSHQHHHSPRIHWRQRWFPQKSQHINISHWRQHSTGRTVHQQSTMGNMHQQPIESITILFTQAEHQQIQEPISHDSNATLYTPAKKPGSCP